MSPARRLRPGRLRLGPIVGHTDEGSACVWIAADGRADDYRLRVVGHGIFPFVSTEATPEFGTAIATATGLRSDWPYRYQVLHRGKVMKRSRGRFRTMPPAGSFADVLFVTVSCSHHSNPGFWSELEDYIEAAEPRFLLMIGDQVYMDQGDDVWQEHRTSTASARRGAMAEKYEVHWRQDPVRRIMANIPTYMIWDDHEIRDGWGSWAGDSPTLAGRYPRGAEITQEYSAHFRDAREVYWHFQAVHNAPAQPGPLPPEPGTDRFAIPFWFDCGRLRVVMLDGRGARDFWRPTKPILGVRQWQFIEQLAGQLPPTIDALAVITPVPIVSMAPEAISMRILRERTDDVALYKEGRAEELLKLQKGLDDSNVALVKALAAEYIPFLSRGISDFHIGDLDDIRDQWSHPVSRPEQEAVIRTFARAARHNRPTHQPRGVVFIGGDIHSGAVIHIDVDSPPMAAECLVASAIAQDPPSSGKAFFLIGEEKYDVADGIEAELGSFVVANNFGVTHVTFGGGTPTIENTLAYEGTSDYWAIKLP